MKKFTLIALAIMASATSFAQTTLWTGEDKEIGSNGGMWDRCNPTVVENTDKNEVNNSEKCLKFTITNEAPDWQHRAIAWGLGENNEIYQDRVLSLKIRKANSGNVKIDLECSDGTHVYTAKWYDGGNTWQKLYFAFPEGQFFNNPKAITIFANNDAEGDQVVYIDDIMLEAQPMVGDKVLSAVDNISGNVTLTGTWLNFTCKNPVNWADITYNSYQDFNNKSANTLTSVDITGAEAHDVDINQFFEKNHNTIVYANDTYNDHDNVVIGKDENGAAVNVKLSDKYAFNIPYGFKAAKVTLTRKLQGGDKGINSFVLPFWVNAEDLKSTSLATYSSENSENVVFTKVTEVGANTPFITVGYSKAEGAKEEEELTWSNKGFVATTDITFNDAFKGVYAPQSAEGLYGINKNGELQKGSETAKIKPFHAYYEAPAGQAAPNKISFEGEATGINNVAAATVADGAVYDLSGRRVAEKLAGASLVKGIYVVNGKKVVVK